MIKVKHKEKEYVFVAKRSCWVNEINVIVHSDTKREILRQLAVESGHTDVDFKKPVSELDQYMDLIDKAAKPDVEPEDQLESKPVAEIKTIVKKEVKKRNPRLKTSTAVSLTSILKSKE